MTQKSHSKIYHKANETLAQLAEHTPFKRRVEGSNPSCLTFEKFYDLCKNTAK